VASRFRIGVVCLAACLSGCLSLPGGWPNGGGTLSLTLDGQSRDYGAMAGYIPYGDGVQIVGTATDLTTITVTLSGDEAGDYPVVNTPPSTASSGAYAYVLMMCADQGYESTSGVVHLSASTGSRCQGTFSCTLVGEDDDSVARSITSGTFDVPNMSAITP